MTGSKFVGELEAVLRENARNRFADNSHGWYAMGDRQILYLDILGLESVTPERERDILEQAMAGVPEMAEAMARLHSRLEDDRSRAILLAVAAYRLLGRRHVKFPYYRDDNIHKREMLAARTRMPDPHDQGGRFPALRAVWGQSFARYNLYAVGRKLVLLTTAETLFMEWYQPAYTYRHGGVNIGVALAIACRAFHRLKAGVLCLKMPCWPTLQ